MLWLILGILGVLIFVFVVVLFAWLVLDLTLGEALGMYAMLLGAPMFIALTAWSLATGIEQVFN